MKIFVWENKFLKIWYFLDFTSDPEPDPFFSQGRLRIRVRIKLIRIHITDLIMCYYKWKLKDLCNKFYYIYKLWEDAKKFFS